VLVPRNTTDVPDEEVLSVLSRPSASRILRAAGPDDPRTVRELSEEASVPLSTTYREVDRLADVDLLEESVALDPDGGHHASRYVRAFETVEVRVTDEGVAVQVLA
jgi:hypothetical protein